MNIYGGLADDYWGETGKALMVLHPGAELPEAEVIASCQEKLAGYKVPRRGRQLIAGATQTQ